MHLLSDVGSLAAPVAEAASREGQLNLADGGRRDWPIGVPEYLGHADLK